ncbi:MAG: tRNA (N(6)-L-threonylcarbamoyladenosine(37)-C(2))-methylthiotransferase MtaB [Pseudoflavonifractor capillosus]|uniref:tRNA (N(6)-L-threonylcarbamoyladenosine(37)-C(2))- methylthiotransferase MtaB n=1 Tax=Pseudoflavonifractor capillosus TaxID=106588 RepID=UPI0023FA0728|nr:tRNA (N(6)-L-threonylcarbamoyladenosine(37)-C(2))-methylthiotransferase MtaB [Pseudoflavonifractor capillosus]MCI5928327.1 tRNA (N(6)-L-threonylcarbamoyladenosine(37)-C(2))-methylthiotransferase MtaB [Pseudoflavonifractor capillosus]MDY4662377.1 tRNA (N(6)-L-threonylcarbamoyladenosine(37)-C(2))-methylthiotransferase MtaB [Pseudoflavonifractor capillosus]
MRYAIYTLGCKVNQYETQALETELLRRGHTLVPFEDEADAYIINTCTVTAVSDRKSRNAIRRAKKRNPAAVVAVCGCYAQTAPDDVAALGVDLVSGTGDRLGFLNEVERLSGLVRSEAKLVPEMLVDNIMTHRSFEQLPAGGLEGRTRAMLKVEDGCVNFCTYCIIPYARGPVRSLSLSAAVEQAEKLAQDGYREIVLTGIEISSWGHEFKDGTSLIDLVEGICHAVPELRVRLGSLEPRTITEDFCRRAAALPNLCPHFHLSMQSGCDAVLKRMNRKYDTARYYESVTLLRGFFDRPAITTDLIVGFPGESEEDFTSTLEFVEKCAFSAMHIFPYSRRTGTPAAKMTDQMPNAVKEERAARAGALAARLKTAYLEQWVGTSLPVLFEEEKNGLWRGHAPNYVEVMAHGEGLHNVIQDVKITELHGDGLLGELL